MIKEVLIILLNWVDPTAMACAPVEAPEAVERADERAARGMHDMGKPQPGQVVDPWGALSARQREAIEHGGRRTGAP